MKKSMMILLIIAAALIVAGLILCAVGFMLFTENGRISFGARNTVTKEYEIAEAFSSVDAVLNTTQVEILPATDGVTRVVCREDVREPHEVFVEDGMLKLRVESKKWYEKISLFSWGEHKLTVYLAEPTLEQLTLTTDTGKIFVSREISVKNATVTFSTARIDFEASVSESLCVRGSTGDVTISGAQYGKLDVKTSTGDITVRGGTAGEILLQVSTGEIEMEQVSCQNLGVTSSTGEQDYERVTVVGAMTLKSSTGDISIEECLAGSAKITTDTGDVEGRFLSDMIFFATTDTGKVRVPKLTAGGICEIQTDTGNIYFQ